MKKHSDEFDKISEDPDLPDFIRKSFRVPVEDAQKVWVTINHQRHDILDVCCGGIRIAVDHPSVFKVDQELSGCELNLFDLNVTGLTGSVIHVSPSDKTIWHCGIQWMDIPKDKAKQIFDIVYKMKDQLLRENVSSFESP